MNIDKQRKIQHLYLRAGFGIDPERLDRLRDRSMPQLVSQLFRDASRFKSIRLLQMEREVKMIEEGGGMPDKKELRKKSRQYVKGFGSKWLDNMAFDEGQLREKMSLFWHDHFACRILRPVLVVNQINTLREHALGNFGELLKAISKDPAMLQFLNNQQNRKSQPNENFARELLELFTLGRGNYTEQDIKEAARAFTGWGFNQQAEFVFRKRQHDFGKKTFMGKTGNWDGEDILDIVLKNKRTAEYITEKIYCYFVNPEPDQKMISKWAQKFYDSGYEIASLLKEIFRSDHFYEARNVGVRIKSPIEYLAGMMRMLDMRFNNERGPFLVQQVLGQRLLNPPDVSGWPDGRSWIDSTTLLARLKLPEVFLLDSVLDMKTRAAFDAKEMDKQDRKLTRQLSTTVNWSPLRKYLKGKDDAETIKALHAYLIQSPDSYYDSKELLKRRAPENPLAFWVSRLICTPEFQLC